MDDRDLVMEAIARHGGDLPMRMMTDDDHAPADRGRLLYFVERRGLTTLRIARNAHHCEGEDFPTREFDLYDLTRQELRDGIEDMVRKDAELLRTDAAIVAAGGDPEEPGAEWHAIRRLFREAIVAVGGDPATLCAIERRTDTGRPELTKDGVRARIMRGSLGRSSLVMGGRLVHRRYLASSLTIVTGSARIDALETSKRVSLAVEGVDLPQTMMLQLVGRRLGDVVEHPLLAASAEETITHCGSRPMGGNGRSLLLATTSPFVNLETGTQQEQA